MARARPRQAHGIGSMLNQYPSLGASVEDATATTPKDQFCLTLSNLSEKAVFFDHHIGHGRVSCPLNFKRANRRFLLVLQGVLIG
jgi:hypothetical protein